MKACPTVALGGLLLWNALWVGRAAADEPTRVAATSPVEKDAKPAPKPPVKPAGGVKAPTAAEGAKPHVAKPAARGNATAAGEVERVAESAEESGATCDDKSSGECKCGDTDLALDTSPGSCGRGPGCENAKKCCNAFQNEWHAWALGPFASAAGAMRGYNRYTVGASLRIGFKPFEFESNLGYTSLLIQTGAEESSRTDALSGDVRWIFAGNTRHRVGFFIGGGFTFVPRPSPPTSAGPTAGPNIKKAEVWFRSPLGLDVRVGAAEEPGVIVVGRVFAEGWYPAGRFEREVTIMFGLGFGVYIGDRNDQVPYAR